MRRRSQSPPGRFISLPGGAVAARQVLSGGAGDVSGDDIGGMPVERRPGPVIAHRGPGISVRGSFLHIGPAGRRSRSARSHGPLRQTRGRAGRRRRGQARPPPLRTPGPGLALGERELLRQGKRSHPPRARLSARARLAVSHCQQLSITPPPPQNQPSPHTIASEASASPEARADVVGLALRSLDEAVDGHRHHQDDLPHRGSLRRGPGGSAAGAQPSAR